MTIENHKLDNGEELKIDTSSHEYQDGLQAGKEMGLRNDDSVFFARNLEYARQTAFKIQYPALKLLNGGLLPIDTSIPEGAEVDSYQIQDSIGKAKIISSFADDVPLVEITGKEVFNKFRSIGFGYVYSYQDTKADQMRGGVGSSILNRKAMVAREGVDQALEELLAFGDTNFGLKGFFNADFVPQTAVSGATWATKIASNPLLIIEDIDKALEAMDTLTKGMERPDTMLVDNVRFKLLERNYELATYEGKTLLNYIETYKGLKVVSMTQLTSKFVGNSNGFVLYKNDRTKLEGVISSRLHAHAPQVKNLVTTNILSARCGGTRVYYPYSVSINYGI